MVRKGLYELCLSPRVAKDWRQKEINPFVSETTESACIIIVIIDITQSIQHYYIGRCIDDSLRSFSFKDFEGFKFYKMYKKFRVKKVLKGIFYIIKLIV